MCENEILSDIESCQFIFEGSSYSDYVTDSEESEEFEYPIENQTTRGIYDVEEHKRHGEDALGE